MQTSRPIVDADSIRFAIWTVTAMLLAASVAFVVGGAAEFFRALIAFSVCLSLSLVTLELSLRSLGHGAHWQMGAILGGSMGRSLLAAGAGLALYMMVPMCRTVGFWVWLVSAYFLTLTLEVTLFGAPLAP